MPTLYNAFQEDYIKLEQELAELKVEYREFMKRVKDMCDYAREKGNHITETIDYYIVKQTCTLANTDSKEESDDISQL